MERSRKDIEEALKSVGFNEEESDSYISSISSGWHPIRMTDIVKFFGGMAVVAASSYFTYHLGSRELSSYLYFSIPLGGLACLRRGPIASANGCLNQLFETARYQRELLSGKISLAEIPEEYGLDNFLLH